MGKLGEGAGGRARQCLDAATYCPKTIFGHFLRQNPAQFLPFKLLADNGYFHGVLGVKIEFYGHFGRFGLI
jgi:hypothetical protein